MTAPRMTMKGQKVRVYLLAADIGITPDEEPFALAKSARVTPNIAVESGDYLGQPTQITEENWNGADIALDFDLKDSAYYKLLTLLVRRVQNPAVSGDIITIVMQLDFPGDTTSKLVSFPDCKCSTASLDATGRTARVGGAITFHSDDMNFLS